VAQPVKRSVGLGRKSKVWTVTRPSGLPWTRTFATSAAAWRVIVPGCNSQAEWRARKAAMERAGWRVERVG
jgi:hypothetical protein